MVTTTASSTTCAGGSGKGATVGILFKNAEAIEVMRKVDTLVVDKTGTLTEGRPALADVVGAGVVSDAELLRLSASLERGSEHPLAAAIVRGAEHEGAVLVSVERFESLTGKGVTGRVDGRDVALGNRALMESLDVAPGDLATRAEELRLRPGRTSRWRAPA